ncbi:MAG: T9SS C-terminal target domain-containing protein [uncultured Aureispira sp.]|uniref:T9SS C-terminal target domain-containing protein n=1 Tax=uncultured Aureispira sp. TaxID=1331704 RepID=A0A6S6SMU7_9BACT|nr:MAG: T9SS C-terminal target domain-containing protein [uncultured Aureispira sp.]
MQLHLTFKLLLCFFLIGLNNNLSAQENFPHIEGEVLIRVKDGHSIAWVIKDLEIHKGLQTYVNTKSLLSEHMNIWQVTFNKDIVSTSKMLEKAKNHPSVHNAQLNYILEKRATPNDASYSQQWQYEQASDFDLDASTAWDITTGGVTALGDTIVICVIDDGLQVNHPDWGDNVWRNHQEIPGNGIDDDGNGYIDDFQGWNADNNDNDIVASGFSTHGTPVAGIIAAQGNNGLGVTGVNWDAKLMFVVGGGNSANSIAAYDYPLACRKLYNQTNGALGAFVVATNASWGVDNQQCATYAPLVNEFYDTLGVHGILSAAATANANNNVDVTGDFPTSCSSDFLITVTNMNQSGNKIGQAGYGLTTVDLGAYGEGTYTLTTNSGYGSFGGTSGATPHVTGIIGLLYSVPCPRLALLARTEPAQTALLLKQIILNSSVSNVDLQGLTVSGGVLNMKNALDSAMVIGCSLSGCHEPYNVLANAVTGTTASINWDRVDSTNLYYLRYRVVGTPTWMFSNTSDTFSLLSGLTACSDYEVEIAADCDSSVYSSNYIFKTGDCCLAPSTITVDTSNLTTATFSWAVDPSVTTYTVEYKLRTASTWLTTTTTSPGITLSGLDSCEAYELRILSTCAVNVNNQYSATIEFETTGCGNCASTNYCTSVGQNSTDDWIQGVSINNINNITGNDGGYVSFVNGGPTTDLAQGGAYPISIDIGFNTGFWATEWSLKVWIDYNQDEIFNDSTELVYDPGLILTATNTHRGTVTIPNNAVLSRTRMRVAVKWGTNLLSSCGNASYGETEDYCINITQPTGITVEEILPSTTLNIYPNPFESQVTVNMNSIEDQTATLILSTITGQEIINLTTQLDLGENMLQLPTNRLPQGVYLMRLLLEDGSILTKKVIKQ